MKIRSVMRAAVPVITLSLVLAACGDDDDAATETTEATEENAELCALATEMFEQEDFPTAAQVEKYAELAPSELEDAVGVAGDAIAGAEGEEAALFSAVAADDVEDAIAEIDAWEVENCGIEHEEPYPDEANEIDPDAARVDVTASEYTFDFEKELSAGPTSFVMTNAGNEVHFMALSRLLDGHTLEEALAFEGDPVEEGLVENAEYDSGLAAPGGQDEEVVTVDLEAGNWVMLCFIPGPDGAPHAFMGMAVPFTVS